MPVPFLGRLDIPEYIALVGSFFLVGFESIIRVLTLALPTSLLTLFYRASRRLFNKFTSPAEKRAGQRRKPISDAVRDASDFVDLCALFGYTAEEHVVQTKDGFLLGLHRLAWKKGEEDLKVNSGPRSIKKRVVYLHHGLLMNSEVWVCLTDAQRALPFLLVEKGFDVWLGNNRGNKYSKKSVHHSPTTLEFWNFSIDEFAFHDIPDSIAYILEATGQKSLSYIGFSQGTAQAFASLAVHPKLNTQVNVFIALAPAMSPAGLHNGIVDALVKASPQVLFLLFGRRSILSSATMWQEIIYPPLFTKVIDISLAFLFNWRTKNISTSQKLAAYPHLYSFTSTKSVVHWFQIIRNKSFQMYDDDVHPPISLSSSSKYTKVAKYPTRNIKTPIVLVYGGSDSLVDIKVMLRELPKQTIATGIPHYEHLDFLWARDVDTLVFPHVFDALESFTGAEHTKEEYERYRAARHTSMSAHASFNVDHKARQNNSSISDVADSDVTTSKSAADDAQDTEKEGKAALPATNGVQPVRNQNIGAPRQPSPQQEKSLIPVPCLPARLSGRHPHGRNGSVDEGSGSEHLSSPDRSAHTHTSPDGRRTPPDTPTRRRKFRSAHSPSLSQDSVQSMREGKGIALGTARPVGGVERVTTQRGGGGEGT
ncbi:alpha/beta-hydrolase [Coniochaeta ligniaria NRRL 30616]|uniref:Alpha/beta-hydrolase n=1 Tax=Coniochaeta ligniaria NRRL 30616 TaxID=1408157 RepID=A0A1J7IV95_9PEZI|nr:alpha/beta-hydrolase [Coniochaeta ligniaria NRRL 30616]